MEEKIFQILIKSSTGLLTSLNIFNWQEDFDLKDVDPRARVLAEEGRKKGIDFFRLYFRKRPLELFKAQNEKKTVVFKQLPLGKSYRKTRQAWVDDKWRAKNILKEAGLPAVDGMAVKGRGSLKRAEEKFNYPLVVKPSWGSLSKGVTTKIEGFDSLEKAFKKGKKYADKLIVEPHIEGHDYRITLIGKEAAAGARRDPANVVSDGKHTLQELILKKNAHSLRSNHRSSTLKKLPLFSLPNHCLPGDWDKEEYVPEKGEKIYLSDKVNLASGADIVDVTEKIHPENKKMFEKIAHIFDTIVLGIDFKSPSIEIPFYSNEGKILELNSLPYINMHHEPWEGKERLTARELLNKVFENS